MAFVRFGCFFVFRVESGGILSGLDVFSFSGWNMVAFVRFGCFLVFGIESGGLCQVWMFSRIQGSIWRPLSGFDVFLYSG